MVRVLLAMIFAALAAGCTAPDRIAAPAPIAPPPPSALVRSAAPTPPDGAALGLAIPARSADGSYATPNRDIAPRAAAWHLRAAFNVAALNCADPQIASAYNRILKLHRDELAQSYRAVTNIHGAHLDPVMTRLYNHFAQPPVLRRFCATAGALATEASEWPRGSFAAQALPALGRIDEPFVDFYARYDAYRAALAAWRSGAPVAAPRLAYDTGFAADARVTGGMITLAAR